MRRVGDVSNMGGGGGDVLSEIWWRKLKERGHLGNLVLKERIVKKRI